MTTMIEPSGRRLLIPGNLPTRNMPKKSVETPKPKPRKPPVIDEMIADKPNYVNWWF